MRFAKVEGKKVEAYKGAKGTCPACGSVVIARCGNPRRVDHWYHKGDRNCDPWWEKETEWHRAWKNNFPAEWQEIPLTDEQTGERHIADVRTSHGLVIEFQHSHIDLQERNSREKFYRNMVWVVDGTRLKNDFTRFQKRLGDFRLTKEKGCYIVDSPEKCLPVSWLDSSVPVVLDFKGTESIRNDDLRNNLYCIFPKSNEGGTIIAFYSRESFIKSIIRGIGFNSQQTNSQQTAKSPIQKTVTARRESNYYYEPRAGRFLKKKRL